MISVDDPFQWMEKRYSVRVMLWQAAENDRWQSYASTLSCRSHMQQMAQSFESSLAIVRRRHEYDSCWRFGKVSGEPSSICARKHGESQWVEVLRPSAEQVAAGIALHAFFASPS